MNNGLAVRLAFFVICHMMTNVSQDVRIFLNRGGVMKPVMTGPN
ncbi:hypothetical protein ERHA54_37980 [Erwinia rhapontici]|uniref:Uncharacterized protein n=1 Tax=Erwinia rhapontici TaxID=55212 RepID=A0ABN6DSB4_ERWRD|nr:hypothetical protein EDF84_10918 [Erwinia rhapontici]BCQ36210.1 hypothetical protein ERHA53_35530 [Erwinia rhapontici]BCQ41195.1 hypothetical protein ERHA54_37980 [Erwinia rhapontici]BCQ46474.1 hypothetical protein ERHA55_40010 [Erwinia rhapontici]